MFYHTLERIENGQDPLFSIYNKVSNYIPENIDYNQFSKTTESVCLLAPFFINKIKRSHNLLESTNEYYIAFDNERLVKYVCFKNILMIDIDNTDMTVSCVIDHFTKLTKYSFSVYKTRNGYHVFCTSEFFDYRSESTVKFMLDNYCDFYYTIFAYIRGFCTRLGRKPDESAPIYEFVADIRPDVANEKITNIIKHIHSLAD